MPTARKARRERINRWLWAVVDSGLLVTALFVACWLRFDFTIEPLLVTDMIWLSAVGVACNLVAGAVLGPYAVGHDRGSFEETADILRSVLVTGVVLVAIILGTSWLPDVPRSVPFTGVAFAMMAMFASRFLIRTWRQRDTVSQTTQERAIIFGAGEAGRRLTRSLRRDAECSYHPVALLDDDKSKARLRPEGVRVRGTRSNMAQVADRYDASTLIIALPQAHATTIRELTELGTAAGLKILILPPIDDIIGGRPTAGDLRDVDVADLLGRRPISLDTAVIAEQIAGRSILVTGAGGSIGSELCRQIVRFGPAKLYLLDRDESGLQATQMSISGHGLLNTDDIVLADIRDVARMHEVMRTTRPDIVFHAAALKHLPLLESNPIEAWKSNVLGTLNVLEAAAEVGVGTFVNISTDKAADPSCVLGYSKRVAERLTADFASREPGRYVSVRFGNVLGSRGSVVHAFTAQIERGGPITVTHPEVERYFMLIPEACQLVLEAASIGSDGDVMVLEMGEQVKIVEVAQTLIRMSERRDIDIVFTGLRPGEKLAEDLFSAHEHADSTGHELVSRVNVPRMDASVVRSYDFTTREEAVRWMKQASGPQARTVPVR